MALTYDRNFSNALELDGKYALVASHLAPQSHILEVGCHTGYFSQALQSRGHRVVCLECDREAAERALAQQLNVLIADVEQDDSLPQNQTFDAIILMDVLEHLRNPEAVLRRMRSSLRPQGKLLITAPNVAYWAVRKNLLLGRWEYAEAGILDRTHLRFFTAQTWRNLFEQAGYQIAAFQSADSMLPLEQYWKALPGMPRLHRWLANRYSSLFSISFFIEAVPLLAESTLDRAQTTAAGSTTIA